MKSVSDELYEIADYYTAEADRYHHDSIICICMAILFVALLLLFLAPWFDHMIGMCPL